MYHRFSEPMKRWSESTNEFTAGEFPSRGSVEYVKQLSDIDTYLYRRRLFESGEYGYTFLDDGSFRSSYLGFLYYTTVSLGTPGQKFMVALDTGSDLLWVPCDCSRCASIDNTAYNSDFKLRYRPTRSSTNQIISCKHIMCTNRHQCSRSDTFDTCPYSVPYISSHASTSGILMEDLLHLETEVTDDEFIGDTGFVDVFVTFGCGQVDTASFLDMAAPNGVFGLSLKNISVPSSLAHHSFITNAFSMCFGLDGTGKISFGDKGSINKEVTSFYVDPLHPTYTITVIQIRVGTSLLDSSFTAIFDSGTSFTYLTDPHYTRLTQKFHVQTKDARHQADQRIPFEYCYDMSPNASKSLIPSMSLTMKGDGQFYIYDPVIFINSEVIYCLAVIRSTELNIIGQNFMTGYRIVFDREELVLGWEKSDCETSTNSSSKILNPNNASYPVVARIQDHGETSENMDMTFQSWFLFYISLTITLFAYSCWEITGLKLVCSLQLYSLPRSRKSIK